jgi:hypothetical protein
VFETSWSEYQSDGDDFATKLGRTGLQQGRKDRPGSLWARAGSHGPPTTHTLRSFTALSPWKVFGQLGSAR